MVFGIPLREGMAGSVRVRNLLYPLVKDANIQLSNIYFALQADGIDDQGRPEELKIDLNFSNPLSIIAYLYKAMGFIYSKRQASTKNIFYLYETPDIKTIIPLLFAKVLGYKVVVDIVEDNSQAASFGGMVNKLRIKSGAFILKYFQAFIDLNIVISSHLESLLLKYTSSEKVLFIPVTMDISKFEESKYIRKEEVTLFYGGSFGKKDGLDLLLKAFEEVSEEYQNLRLVLTGKGENVGDFEEFMELVRASKFSSSISYKGFIPSQDYQKLLNSCDIFCVIRDDSGAASTGFPSKLAEYLATGRAVIVTAVGDVSYYLTDKENAVLVKPMDLASLVAAIKYLLDRPEEIDKIGRKGRLVAIEKFNNSVESRKLLNVLNSRI